MRSSTITLAIVFLSILGVQVLLTAVFSPEEDTALHLEPIKDLVGFALACAALLYLLRKNKGRS